MVWEELASPQAPMAREARTELFACAVRETEQGVVVHRGKIVAVVGRKPSR